MKISLKRVLAALAASAVSATSVSGMMPVVAVEAGSASADAFPFVIEGEDMEGASLWTQNYGPAPKDSSGDGFFYLTGTAVVLRFLYTADVGTEIALIITHFLIVVALTFAHCRYLLLS